jgi:hypothetical protein
MARLWKINCMEYRYPGMWQRWYRLQCVGIGWYSDWGYYLSGPSEERGWSRARNALCQIAIGDHIVVALQNNRVGRIGEVTGKAIEDSDWDPLVPPSTGLPDGEMGRRIFVRWDMTVGPDDREMVVYLPEDARFTFGELRPTLQEIHSIALKDLKRAMNDPSNWVGLLTHFDYESALSGYIAAYPHRLEDGLLPHPNERVRERVFRDGSRLDVLLIDRNEVPVIVECKQWQPTVADLKQLRHYLMRLEKETKQKARGILVHGGSRKLHRDIIKTANQNPRIELVQYKLDVEFASCN